MQISPLLLTALVVFYGSDARAPLMDIVSVTTPRQLQESVSTGVAHVIVNEHLDISKLPSLSGILGPGAEVLAIQRNSDGQYTKSIVVRCTFDPNLCDKRSHALPPPNNTVSGSSITAISWHATGRLGCVQKSEREKPQRRTTSQYSAIVTKEPVQCQC